MTDSKSSIPLVHTLSQLASSHEHNRVLQQIHEEYMPARQQSPEVKLQAAEALIALERFHEARRTLAPLWRADQTVVVRARALVCRAEIEQLFNGDMAAAVEHGRRAAELAESFTAEDLHRQKIIMKGRGIAALALIRKGAVQMADKELTHALDAVGDCPLLAWYRSRAYLETDRRAPALEVLENSALEKQQYDDEAKRLLALGKAGIARILGDFALAHACLDKIETSGSCDLPLLQERLDCYLSSAEDEKSLVVLEQILSASPASVFSRSRRFQHADTLLRLGRESEAQKSLALLSDENLNDLVGREARRLLRVLNKNTNANSKESKLVQGFGSLTQLKDHCGPACCELLLSFYGLTGYDQQSIASEVKLKTGTPIYAMRGYLEKRGLHVRRVEAELPLMKKLLDADIPFVMLEEYSSSHHVAVAVGYDDKLERLTVQDPMTHALRRTPYDDLPKLLAMGNNAIVIAVPASKPEKIALLDDIGAFETHYITMTDKAQMALDAGSVDEAERLADESIALRRDYGMSWICKFSAVRIRSKTDRSCLPQLRTILQNILALWPDDEWPLQYKGHEAFIAGDYETALKDFELARDRDFADGYNWSMMGSCQIALGREQQALSTLEEALHFAPADISANREITRLLIDRGQLTKALVFSEVALEQNPDDYYVYETHADLLFKCGRVEEALEYADKSLSIQKNYYHAIVTRARALHALERKEEACSLLCEYANRVPHYALRVCEHLLDFGQHAMARETCESAVQKFQEGATQYNELFARAIIAVCEIKAGKTEEGIVQLESVLHESPNFAWASDALGKACYKLGKNSEAVQHLAAASLWGHKSSRRYLAEALSTCGAYDEAVHQAQLAAREMDVSEADLQACLRVVAAVRGLDATRQLLREIVDAGKVCRSPILLSLLEPDVATPPAVGNTQLSPGQRWILAAGGILHTINSAQLDLMAGYPRPSGMASNILRYWWNVRTVQEARNALNDLRNAGHRFDYARSAKCKLTEFIAWDYMRMTNVAGWCYGAGLLEKEEAWAAMTEAARVLQFTYSSWEELGLAYCRDHSRWAEDELETENKLIQDGLLEEDKRKNRFLKVDDDSLKAIKKLLAEGGVWSELPWETSLNNIPPPIEPEVEIYPENDKPLEHTLNEAIASGLDLCRTRIRMLLKPGVYRAAIDVMGSLEIVGLGEGVIIETKDQAEESVIVLDQPDSAAGLILSNLEIRTRDNEHELIGIDIRSGLLRMDKVYVNGGDWGIFLANSSALGHINNCKIVNNDTGIWIDYGTAICDSITVTNSKKHGIHILENGKLEMNSSHIHEHASYGISCWGSAKIHSTHIDQTKGASFGLLKNGRAIITQCRFTNSDRFGVYVEEGAKELLVKDTLLEGHKHAGMQAISLEHYAEFVDCLIRKNDTGGANLYPGKNVAFYDCRFEQLQPAAVQIIAKVDEWTDAALVQGCLFSQCNGGAIDICNGGKLHVNDSIIEKSTSFGVLVRGELSELKTRQLTVSDVEKAGINAHTGGLVEAVDCAIENSGYGILLQAGGKFKGVNIELSKNAEPLAFYGEHTEAELTNLALNADQEKMMIRENASCILKNSRIDGGEGVYAIDNAKLYAQNCEFINCKDANIVSYADSHIFLDSCLVSDFNGEALVACANGKLEARNCEIKPNENAIAFYVFEEGEIQFRSGTLVSGNYTLAKTKKVDDETAPEGKLRLFDLSLEGQSEEVKNFMVDEMESFDDLLAQHFSSRGE